MLFTIIAAHYQPVVSDKEFIRFMASLHRQDCKDFELIIVHDGPWVNEPSIKGLGFDVKLLNTEKRYNKWGHPSRDLGLKHARGEYILFTNCDNIYYQDTLQVLKDNLEETIPIYTMPLKMCGMNYVDGQIWYDDPRDFTKFMIMRGKNPRYGTIDMMQLISKKEIWDKRGGWLDYRECSDGYIYQELVKKYKFKYIEHVMGEHY